jgi:hypothetical protein
LAASVLLVVFRVARVDPAVGREDSDPVAARVEDLGLAPGRGLGVRRLVPHGPVGRRKTPLPEGATGKNGGSVREHRAVTVVVADLAVRGGRGVAVPAVGSSLILWSGWTIPANRCGADCWQFPG